MRVLGLDVGDKRIGIAVSDKSRELALNLMTLKRKNIKQDLKILRDIIKEKEVNLIVIGLPLNMNGSLSRKAEDILKFKDRLNKKINIEITTFDERLTSKQAESVLIKADISRKKRKEKIDKIAAQLILQGFLDSRE